MFERNRNLFWSDDQFTVQLCKTSPTRPLLAKNQPNQTTPGEKTAQPDHSWRVEILFAGLLAAGALLQNLMEQGIVLLVKQQMKTVHSWCQTKSKVWNQKLLTENGRHTCFYTKPATAIAPAPHKPTEKHTTPRFTWWRINILNGIERQAIGGSDVSSQCERHVTAVPLHRLQRRACSSANQIVRVVSVTWDIVTVQWPRLDVASHKFVHKLHVSTGVSKVRSWRPLRYFVKPPTIPSQCRDGFKASVSVFRWRLWWLGSELLEIWLNSKQDRATSPGKYREMSRDYKST